MRARPSSACAARRNQRSHGVPHVEAPSLLKDRGDLLESETRTPRIEFRRIAKADVDQEIRFRRPAGEELRIDLGVVEAAHRPGVEPDRAQRQQQIGALQRAVAKGRRLDQRRVADEPGARVGRRIEPRQMLVELRVMGDDRRRRRGERLVEIARRQRRRQPRLGLRRTDEDEARRQAIGAGRPPEREPSPPAAAARPGPPDPPSHCACAPR